MKVQIVVSFNLMSIVRKHNKTPILISILKIKWLWLIQLRYSLMQNQDKVATSTMNEWGKLPILLLLLLSLLPNHTIPDNTVHWANMGPTWALSAPDGPHDGPMNLAIRAIASIVLVNIGSDLLAPSHYLIQCWLVINNILANASQCISVV